MKPLLIKERAYNDTSFMLKRKEFAYFPVNFHYHNELELVLKVESTGEMIVGNYAGRFQNRNLFLLGENLPHYWKNDEEYYLNPKEGSAVSIVAHFDRCFAGKELFEIPELAAVNALFERAKRGVLFGTEITEQAAQRMQETLNVEGFQRFISFLELLHLLAMSDDYVLLSTDGFVKEGSSLFSSEPLQKVYEYVMMNFRNEISQTVVADRLGMNVSAFSRFFRKSTKKTFTQFVNEVRLGHVCRLMIENELNITQIAYECGYKNLSNFNNQFRAVLKQTPSQYKAALSHLSKN